MKIALLLLVVLGGGYFIHVKYGRFHPAIYQCVHQRGLPDIYPAK